jgi:hypothetical protein
MKMSVVNKLSKEVLNLFNFTKDSAKQAITEFAFKEKIAISPAQLNQLLLVVESSIDQSYQKSLGSFQKTVELQLDKKYD